MSLIELGRESQIEHKSSHSSDRIRGVGALDKVMGKNALGIVSKLDFVCSGASAKTIASPLEVYRYAVHLEVLSTHTSK